MSEATDVAIQDQDRAPAFPIERVLATIIQASQDPATEVSKMKELFALQKELLVMQAQAEFNRALMRLPAIYVKKHGVIDLGAKGAIPFAKFEDMMKVVEPLLQAQRLRLLFTAEPRAGDGGGLIVTATLLHGDGHFQTASVPLPLDAGPGRNNVQAMGSSLSYGRRYCVEMLLNIVREGEDDDGKLSGTKFVTPAEAEELRALVMDANRKEDQFLHTFFGGHEGTPQSFDAIEAGTVHVAVKNTLQRLVADQRRKAEKKEP